ncbi:MAG: tetratricopeptide repeat protein, partial [Paracoccaceae bacterium]
DMGRYEEAEPLYREAIKIDKAALGEGHPSYAIDLNNLANLLKDMGRYEEAEPLIVQAIGIAKAELGEEHPSYAIRLWVHAAIKRSLEQFDAARPLYAKALEIQMSALGEDHPNTRKNAEQYLSLLRKHFPDDPALAELEATFGPDIGKE